jgi:hypothetical protein
MRHISGQQRRIRMTGTRVLISGTSPRQSCAESKDALQTRHREAGDAARQGHRPGNDQACASNAVSAFTAHRFTPGFSALMTPGCFSNRTRKNPKKNPRPKGTGVNRVGADLTTFAPVSLTFQAFA